MTGQIPDQASKPTTPAISTPTPTPGSGPTISSSASTSSSRPYVPQFSAATQLILQRLKAKEAKNDGGTSFSSVVSSTKTSVATGGSGPTIKLEPDVFEDAKKRLVAGTGLKTSTMSLKMPLTMPSSIKMPTPAPKTTTTTTIKKEKNLSLPSSSNSLSTVPRAGSTTNLSLPLPLPPPPQPPKHKSLTFKSGTSSAIKNINSGLTASGKVSLVKPPKPAVVEKEAKPKKAKTSTGNPVGRPPKSSKAKAAAAARAADALATAAGDAITGGGDHSHRRKRIKQQQQDVDELSSLSSLSDVSEPDEAAFAMATPSGSGSGSGAAASALLTMTKSGRQVLKPTTYNPVAVEAANKKHRSSHSQQQQHYGKRTAEQALCKKCTRLHSPAQNPMVFCDGCNEGWHQRCHEPVIPTEVIRDQTKGWICSACVVAKSQKHHPGKKQQQKREQQEQQATRTANSASSTTSWADKPPQQKRAYLSTLPPQELVSLIMLALEVKPDLPIFPGPPSAPAQQPAAKGNSKSNLKDLVRQSRETTSQDEGGGGGGGEEDEEYDPLAALWPKAGNGLYSMLPFDADDDDFLVDSGDFEAFSSIVYDDRGRKVLENGLRV